VGKEGAAIVSFSLCVFRFRDFIQYPRRTTYACNLFILNLFSHVPKWFMTKLIKVASSSATDDDDSRCLRDASALNTVPVRSGLANHVWNTGRSLELQYCKVHENLKPRRRSTEKISTIEMNQVKIEPRRKAKKRDGRGTRVIRIN
jgi:hypothetical protein